MAFDFGLVFTGQASVSRNHIHSLHIASCALACVYKVVLEFPGPRLSLSLGHDLLKEKKALHSLR